MFNSELIFPLIGGLLIGVAASTLVLFNGKIFGVSGLIGGVLVPQKNDVSWRVSILSGLLFGGVLLKLFYSGVSFKLITPWFLFVVGGFLTGFGALLGNGCTSGHGICGMGRLSPRSIVATAVFMTFAMLSVFVIRHLLLIY